MTELVYGDVVRDPDGSLWMIVCAGDDDWSQLPLTDSTAEGMSALEDTVWGPIIGVMVDD